MGNFVYLRTMAKSESRLRQRKMCPLVGDDKGYRLNLQDIIHSLLSGNGSLKKYGHRGKNRKVFVKNHNCEERSESGKWASLMSCSIIFCIF